MIKYNHLHTALTKIKGAEFKLCTFCGVNLQIMNILEILDDD